MQNLQVSLTVFFSPYNRTLPDQKKLFGNYTLIHKQNPRSWRFFHDSWKRGQNERKYFWLRHLKNLAATKGVQQQRIQAFSLLQKYEFTGFIEQAKLHFNRLNFTVPLEKGFQLHRVTASSFHLWPRRHNSMMGQLPETNGRGNISINKPIRIPGKHFLFSK